MADRVHPEVDPRWNAILKALPRSNFEAVVAAGEFVVSQVRDQVYEAGGPVEWVYFPLQSVFSMVAPVQGGQHIEVGTIGREAFAGLPVYLGAATSPHATFCQVAGPSFRLSVPAFRSALEWDGPLHRILQRSVQVTIVQLAQNAACNVAHTTMQRASRWLLMTQDRVMHDTFLLTQEFLAQMLGLRRATVTETARELQRAGLIEYRRGRITISDRTRLEATACECYGIIRREFDAVADS